jgi:hypothetical protein
MSLGSEPKGVVVGAVVVVVALITVVGASVVVDIVDVVGAGSQYRDEVTPHISNPDP